MQPDRPDPQALLAGAADTGKTCPYCRFPLKEGTSIMRCGVCQATHHGDCWQDNGGCAVIACAGGPTSSPADREVTEVAAATRARPAVQPPFGGSPPGAPPPSPAPTMWQPGAQPPQGGRGPWLPVAVVILAIAVVGAGVAVVLSRQNNDVRLAASAQTVTSNEPGNTETTTDSTTTTPDSEEATTTSVSDTGDTTPSSADGVLPDEPIEQLRQEIQGLLYNWHEDIVNGDNHGAWELLSKRKRQQSLEKYGYPGWVHNQATLKPYLDPSGIRVNIDSTEPDTGVATVDVKGMSWNKPGAHCSEWSGITWVKYEQGAWRYDPGYSTTPERESKWKSRFADLLGGKC
jgi:hypothetical protein